MSLLIFLILVAFAGEADNFSGRNTPPQNDVVNQYFQRRLQSLAEKHNEESAGTCSEKVLYALAKDELDKNFPDIYDLTHLLRTDGPKKFDVDKSIYADVDIYATYVPSLALKFGNKTVSVGFDKIDHLFSHGFLNWEMMKRDPKLPPARMIQTLKFNYEQEHGPWGLAGAGVKAYGDLSANYHGTFFWRDFLHGDPPFLKCTNGKYVVSKKFKIEEYLDSSVDEAINCSSFKDAEMAKLVVDSTKKLGRKCPVDAGECQSLSKKYPGEVGKMILHPLCRGEKHSQIEKPTKLTVKQIMDQGTHMISGSTNLMTMFLPNYRGDDEIPKESGRPKSQKKPERWKEASE